MNSYQNYYRMKILNEASICKDSFYEFVKRAWNAVETNEYIDGWYIKAICDYLQAIFEEKLNKDLIINIPPRFLKTKLVGVFWPAWVWTRKPEKKFIFASYAARIAIDEGSIPCRKILQSKWYQERFPNVKLEKTLEDYLINTAGGTRKSIGVDGSGTGRGADYLVADDLISAEEQYSDAAREKSNRWFDQTYSTRGNTKNARRIIVCQRLHQDDIVGHVLDKGEDWEQLILPIRYDGVRFVSSIGFVDPRKEGELLHPERFDEEWVQQRELTLGSYAFAGQYIQRPTPLSGSIFKKHWFTQRIDLPKDKVAYRFLSFDVAGTKTGDYSACVVGELVKGSYFMFVREVDRQKLEFPQLLEWIQQKIYKYSDCLDAIYIEYASNGLAAVQSLKDSAEPWISEMIYPINPKESKDARGYGAAVWAEAGCIWLPPENHPDYPWLFDFQNEIFSYPASKHDDQFDALNQLILVQSDNLAEGLRYRKQGGMNALY